ncbi:urate hydroxylase PuuD [Leeia sp.]|uniref:urate hydroxylase PuuD n=1 Tax=Leeia sp. TaxID=2884678 RepID=UPI0035B3C663
MEGYLLEWANLLLRWLHLIVGIAWIGSSFYFVWLDNSLRPPKDADLKARGVDGELWAVHGGGFYNPQKYLLAPKHLPDELHWFKWESYSTWLTGFLLISVLYYLQAGTYMVDQNVADLSPQQAVLIGLGTLAGGWLVYDTLCRLFFNRSQLLFGVVYYAFVVFMAWLLTHLLSGRAAFIHVGAMIATTMTANVFFWIIPGQKKVVAMLKRGEQPDPVYGKRGKQRSVHNNYLTLPVLFCMISNHYAFTYNHPQAWLVLALIFLAAVLIRHFFNLRHKGVVAWHYPLAGIAILLGVLLWLRPTPVVAVSAAPAAAAGPTYAEVRQILQHRCASCHAAAPTQPGFASAPAGVKLDNDADIQRNLARIQQQAVVLKAMPLGNLTGMTDAERTLLKTWFAAGAKMQ